MTTTIIKQQKRRQQQQKGHIDSMGGVSVELKMAASSLYNDHVMGPAALSSSDRETTEANQ